MTTGTNSDGGHVVLLHGLFHRGVAMSVLSRRLRRGGFASTVFSYPSRRRELSAHAAELRDFIDTQKLGSSVAPLHFVGHSLGGLIIMTLLEKYSSDLPMGRVVLLGSPVRGSSMAQRLGRQAIGRAFLGSARHGLESGSYAVARREIGVIAGIGNKGIGRLLGGLLDPNDGTVAVAETVIEGAAASIQLPVSHFGMLLSPEVARESTHFLRSGRFKTKSQDAG